MPNQKTPQQRDSSTLKLMGCLFISVSILALIGFLNDGSIDGRIVGFLASGVLLAVGVSALLLSWRLRRS